jgi:hypothetical protein
MLSISAYPPPPRHPHRPPPRKRGDKRPRTTRPIRPHHIRVNPLCARFVISADAFAKFTGFISHLAPRHPPTPSDPFRPLTTPSDPFRLRWIAMHSLRVDDVVINPTTMKFLDRDTFHIKCAASRIIFVPTRGWEIYRTRIGCWR